MLACLLSGEYASAIELAHAASVAPATASGHLRQLLDARFVVCAPRGRLSLLPRLEAGGP